MIERMPPMPDKKKFEVGSWIRLKDDAPSRTRAAEYAPLSEQSYVICWRNEPHEYSPDRRYIISDPVTADVMDAIKAATSELDVQQILIDAGRIVYYIGEDEIADGKAAEER